MTQQVKRGAQRTGRSAAVRAFLETQTEAVSARQIMDVVEPGGDINLMTATLATLLRNNAVEKHGAGLGRVRWKALPAAVRERSAARATATLRPCSKQTAPPRSRRTPSPTIVQPRSTAKPEQKTNFPASHRLENPSAKRRASVDAETVAEFQRRGGRIQVLPLGQCSQPLQYDHSNYADYRARGRATQKRNRATKGA